MRSCLVTQQSCLSNPTTIPPTENSTQAFMGTTTGERDQQTYSTRPEFEVQNNVSNPYRTTPKASLSDSRSIGGTGRFSDGKIGYQNYDESIKFRPGTYSINPSHIPGAAQLQHQYQGQYPQHTLQTAQQPQGQQTPPTHSNRINPGQDLCLAAFKYIQSMMHHNPPLYPGMQHTSPYMYPSQAYPYANQYAGMQTKYEIDPSEAPLEQLRMFLARTAAGQVQVGGYSREKRLAKIMKYKHKQREWKKKHELSRVYTGRRRVAGNKPRVHGRFVSREEYLKYIDKENNLNNANLEANESIIQEKEMKPKEDNIGQAASNLLNNFGVAGEEKSLVSERMKE